VTSTPPGWYPDPFPPPGVAPALRFWDGRQWTPHLAPPPGVAFPAVTQSVLVPTTPDGVPLASWWTRVAAFFLDSLIVSTVGTVLTLPLQFSMQQDLRELIESDPEPGELLSAYVDIFMPLVTWTALASFAVWASYSAIMLRTKSATAGKLALGLEVRLRDRPGQLGWGTIAARVLAQQGYALTAFVPVLYLALFWVPWLDALWATWDKKRQTLHDKVARTNVVRTR
jgi:uncharacterized RDD family membrane protein YckC